MTSPRRLLITGASGYIGSILVDTARAAGVEVVAARPRPRLDSRDGVAQVRFDLRRPADADSALAGVDAVVHLAAILGESGPPRADAPDPNVEGTRRLLEAARERGVRRFVFVSSHSAAQDAPTRYGRSKWEIEQLLTGEGEVAARVGLVSGGPRRGLYGRLLRLCARHPLLPLPGAGAPVYPIHVREVCRSLLALAGSPAPPGRRFWLGSSEPVRFGDHLRTLARERLGRRVRLLPLPAWPILLACRLAESLPFFPAPPTERVRGLLALGRVDAASGPGPHELGFALADFRESLAREGQRRRQLAEGAAFLRYVLGQRPPSGALRRYARALSGEPDARPLDLPALARTCPPLLRLVEPVGRGSSPLRRRLDLATAIVEMTPEGAERFHAYAGATRVAAFAGLFWLVLSETGTWVIRAVFGRIVSGRKRV